ncbi:transcription factor Hsr1 [Phytophthora boehmeriae]|uniref:Transcription factor Hsr1 n=1 Tax=Phytophthora boehmeriae TaxID=109152 RepID=A0A8T1WPA9_9STRA|nr:transcription factor Hsr1 [Phytophthora boehmeriae]
MAAGIPTGFVRKLYRILDHESSVIIGWDTDGSSFSIHDSAALDAEVLPRYFRGRLSAFRQQLVDHNFKRRDCEENEAREEYFHPNFRRGCPECLNKIERKPKKSAKTRQNGHHALNKAAGTVPNASNLKGNLSLTVRLQVPPLEGKRTKRSREPEAETDEATKRLKQQEQQKTKTKNPLFTNDPETTLSLAKFVEGSGLLPASSELPDPISYLSKTGGNESAAQDNGGADTDAVPVPIFSDDMVKSALFFLVSSSCTGVEKNPATTMVSADVAAPAVAAGTTTAPNLLTAATTSTSSFLASLLASSSTGGNPTTAWARGSNPLFSDQTMDGEDDSIWNLLVASSVDRVRSAIDGVTSQQEKLQLILDEREKLEEQRKRVGAPAGPIVPRRPAGNSPQGTQQKQQNPLFATETTSPSVRDGPAEDDLWRLLMSSSIDSFRRVTDGL